MTGKAFASSKTMISSKHITDTLPFYPKHKYFSYMLLE